MPSAQNRGRVFDGRSARALCAAAAIVIAACPSLARPEPAAPAPAALRVDPAWLDASIPAAERALLDRSLGHAPPEAGNGAKWFASEPASFAQWRGKVVVLQTWTVATEPGRSALARVREELGELAEHEDVVLAGLHTPQSARNAAVYLENKPAAMPVLIDELGSVCDDLGVWRRPVALVIGRSGAVRAAGVSPDALPDVVRAALAEPVRESAAPPSVVPSRSQPAAAPTVAGAPARFPDVRGVGSATNRVGQRGPEIVAQHWLTGQPQTAGKTVILDFWATWCPPCRASIPHLNELAAAFKDDVVIVGVSDETRDKLDPFVARTSMTYSVASDPGRRMFRAFNPRGIPYCVIMSPDGVVRWQGHPMQMDAALVRQIVEAGKAAGTQRSAATDGAGDAPADDASMRWLKPSR